MWRSAGIRRDRERLTEARDTIAGWCQYALARQLRDSAGWALQNMLIVAELMVTAALQRERAAACTCGPTSPAWTRTAGNGTSPSAAKCSPLAPRAQ